MARCCTGLRLAKSENSLNLLLKNLFVNSFDGAPNAFYQAGRRQFDTDPAFAERARSRLVRLQAGDPDTLAIWQRLVDISRE